MTAARRTSSTRKLFCCHRADRKDAVDAKGRRLDDVLMFRVADLEAKELLLGDAASPYFTTPHFDGYPAVLLRIAHLRRISARSCSSWSPTRGSRARRSAPRPAWLAEQDL